MINSLTNFPRIILWTNPSLYCPHLLFSFSRKLTERTPRIWLLADKNRRKHTNFIKNEPWGGGGCYTFRPLLGRYIDCRLRIDGYSFSSQESTRNWVLILELGWAGPVLEPGGNWRPGFWHTM
jgi:hypothetical protein